MVISIKSKALRKRNQRLIKLKVEPEEGLLCLKGVD